MNTEQFIRDATRGLSRRKRAEAQTELRSHLHERTNQLILLGKSLPSAQAQAIQELGAPGEIARGLRRVEHVHPLLSAAVLTAIAGVLLGFPAVDAWQSWRNNEDPRRIARSEAQLRQEGLTSLPEARDQLQKSGIDLKFFGPWAARLEAPGLPTVKLDMSCQQPVYADPGLKRLWPEFRPAHLIYFAGNADGLPRQCGLAAGASPRFCTVSGKNPALPVANAFAEQQSEPRTVPALSTGRPL